jgi:hypothetical protein
MAKHDGAFHAQLMRRLVQQARDELTLRPVLALNGAPFGQPGPMDVRVGMTERIAIAFSQDHRCACYARGAALAHDAPKERRGLCVTELWRPGAGIKTYLVAKMN